MSLTISLASGNQITKYFNVVGIAILIFDYAITIEDEVQWVWGRPWDLTRVIFTISRYVPIAGMGLTAYSAVRSESMPCPSGVEVNVIHSVGIAAAELLLLLRTYAFWQGSKRILYPCLIYGGLTAVAGVIFNIIPNQLVSGGDVNISCFMTANRNGAILYAMVLVFELAMFFLTVYKKIRDYQGVATRKSLIYTLYIDGVFYMLCISLVTIVNVIVDLALPMEYIDMLDIPQIALHDALAARIIFNLRKRTHAVQLTNTAMTANTVPMNTMEYHVPAEEDELELQGTDSLLDSGTV